MEPAADTPFKETTYNLLAEAYNYDNAGDAEPINGVQVKFGDFTFLRVTSFRDYLEGFSDSLVCSSEREIHF